MNNLLKWFLIILLRMIDSRKPLGKALFDAVARLTVTPTLEVVVLKDNGGELEVLLTQRTVNDSSFPNMWHVPGTVIRPGETLDVSLKRLAQTELGVEIESYEIAGLINNLKEPRGHFISPILLVKLRQSPKVGKWQNVKNLDETVIDFHKYLIIPRVLEFYNSKIRISLKIIENK